MQSVETSSVILAAETAIQPAELASRLPPGLVVELDTFVKWRSRLARVMKAGIPLNDTGEPDLATVLPTSSELKALDRFGIEFPIDSLEIRERIEDFDFRLADVPPYSNADTKAGHLLNGVEWLDLTLRDVIHRVRRTAPAATTDTERAEQALQDFDFSNSGRFAEARLLQLEQIATEELIQLQSANNNLDWSAIPDTIRIWRDMPARLSESDHCAATLEEYRVWAVNPGQGIATRGKLVALFAASSAFLRMAIKNSLNFDSLDIDAAERQSRALLSQPMMPQLPRETWPECLNSVRGQMSEVDKNECDRLRIEVPKLFDRLTESPDETVRRQTVEPPPKKTWESEYHELLAAIDLDNGKVRWRNHDYPSTSHDFLLFLKAICEARIDGKEYQTLPQVQKRYPSLKDQTYSKILRAKGIDKSLSDLIISPDKRTKTGYKLKSPSNVLKGA